jgi:RNA polymerase primary sigma factor
MAVRLQEELGREPTDEELGEEMRISARTVAQMRTAALPLSSLDAPIRDEESNSFGDMVQDEHASTPYEQLEEKTVMGMLQDMVKTLEPREVTILRARFGLDDGREQTLDEVGHKVGLTRERIRQLQIVALTKLRNMFQKVEARKI